MDGDGIQVEFADGPTEQPTMETHYLAKEFFFIFGMDGTNTAAMFSCYVRTTAWVEDRETHHKR